MHQFHSLHNILRKASKWVHVVRGRLTKVPATSSPDYLWPEVWSTMPKSFQQKEKTAPGYRKAEARQCSQIERIFFTLIRTTWSSRTPWKVRAKKLEVPLGYYMPCKLATRYGETWCTQNSSRKTRYACIVEATESTRTRIGTNQPRDHEDLIAGKGFMSLGHYNLVHEPYSHTSRMRRPQLTKSGKRSKKCKRSRRQVKSKQEVIEKAQKEARTVHFAILVDICHLKL